MHVKKRAGKALLYRSIWVRKGAEGNSHGFSRQLYVGCVPGDCVELPPGLMSKLSATEREYVELHVLQPARRAAAQAEAERQRRSRDPVWRLEEGLRLIHEAAALSAQARVPFSRVQSLRAALDEMQLIGEVPRRAEKDALHEAVAAVRRAAKAIADGQYGRAPQDGVRKSHVYARWLELTQEVDGSAPEGLLRQLQRSGWVKAKGA